jgi:lysophospholipase L1-like esterase
MHRLFEPVRSAAACAVLLLGYCGCLRQIPDAPPAAATPPAAEAGTAEPAKPQREVPSPPSGPEVADEPSPRAQDHSWMSRASWWKRHWALLDISPEKKQKAQFILIGDSITEGFDDVTWRQAYAGYGGLKLGIGGDKTQEVLFRIQDGELQGMNPKVAALFIGTNNLGWFPADAIARGVQKIVAQLLERLPQSKVLIIGILPRDEAATSQKRAEVAEANALLQKLADKTRVFYVDIGKAFLNADGSIDKSVMGDFLHPTQKGYRIFTEALAPALTPLL